MSLLLLSFLHTLKVLSYVILVLNYSSKPQKKVNLIRGCCKSTVLYLNCFVHLVQQIFIKMMVPPFIILFFQIQHFKHKTKYMYSFIDIINIQIISNLHKCMVIQIYVEKFHSPNLRHFIVFSVRKLIIFDWWCLSRS